MGKTAKLLKEAMADLRAEMQQANSYYNRLSSLTREIATGKKKPAQPLQRNQLDDSASLLLAAISLPVLIRALKDRGFTDRFIENEFKKLNYSPYDHKLPHEIKRDMETRLLGVINRYDYARNVQTTIMEKQRQLAARPPIGEDMSQTSQHKRRVNTPDMTP